MELQRDRDIYRLPYPIDAEGRNLYESSLDRLDAWQRLHAGEFQDIINFTRGLCHEQLAQPTEAMNAYAAVQSNDPELQAAAEERAAVMRDFDRLFRPPLESREVAEEFTREAARSRAEEAVEKYRGTEWEDLAMVLAEKQALEECQRLRASQGRTGVSAYRAALEELIARFGDSKNIYQHRLRLGLYYEGAMREWITQAELGSDDKAWQLAQEAYEKAAQIYIQVSQADGFPAKREAEARLVALEETARKIDNHLR